MLIFLINLLVLDLPNKSGPIIILAFFKAYVIRYYRRLSLYSSSLLSSLITALVSLLAFLFSINPK